MKVLAAIVVPPHLSVSGGARAAEALSHALARWCTVDVASMLAGPDTATHRPCEHQRRIAVRSSLPLGLARLNTRYRTLFYRSTIPRAIRDGDYDLVHLHNPMPALEMGRIARTCRSLKIPYVVSTHGFNEIVNGPDIYGFGPLRRAAWTRLVLAPVRDVVAGAARIFTLSPHDESLLARLGYRGNELTLVSNGVDAPAEGDDHQDRQLLDGLGIAPRSNGGPPTFLFLANHTPNKGLPVLFEAFASLTAPFQLILAGDRRPGVAYEALIRGARPGQKIVVTGRLDDREVAACFRRADCFVFPTLADTFPLVVLEAMAHGVPVIASAVGGIPYQLRNDCGVLVESGDPAALARALDRFIARPQEASRLSAAARARVLSDFTWERAAERAFEGYGQVMSVRHAVRAEASSRASPARVHGEAAEPS